MKKILIGICGIGNGHVNRQMLIIEELRRDC
jgi:UDP:flavonoid glycosyltransferase YjiC (YdhE family)